MWVTESLATSSAVIAPVKILNPVTVHELNVSTEPSMKDVYPQLVGMALKSQSMPMVKILLPPGPHGDCPAVAGTGVPSIQVGYHLCKV